MSVFKTKPTLITALVSSLFLAGCGGGGDSSTDGGTTASTGVFIDSVVRGISYKTATHSGVTNADGEYEYEVGETVTFSIGGVNFPPVEAKGVVTPFDMSSTSNGQLNIGLLLQSLDADGDASDGIDITSDSLTHFEGLASPDFETDIGSFKSNFAAGEVATWKLEGEVRDHLANASGYVGSWMLSTSGPDGLVIVKMTANGQYFILSDQKPSSQIADALQIGTYVFNSETNEVTLTGITGNDVEKGIGPQSGVPYSLRLSGDLNSFVMVVNENDYAKFNRIVDVTDEVKAPDALYGVWKFDSGSTSPTDQKIISFNKDNTYIDSSLGGSDSTDVLFFEKGVYEIGAATASTAATLSVVKVTDTMDKTRGLSNEENVRFSLTDGVLSLTVKYNGKDETATLTKILPFTAK